MPPVKTPRLALALAVLSLLPALRADDSVPPPGPDPHPMETKAQHDARLAWWREARFGMFIHWGIYSVPAGTWQGRQVPGIGEWIMNKGKIPVADYEAFAAQFDPVKFDADAWVALAKSAGMKYIVITAKHHDGFAMYRSAVDRYNIYDSTPFHRDPLKELAAACLRQGMKLGFYYSQSQDWHAPGASAIGGHWDPARQDGDMDAYLRTKSVPQVRELLANYQPFPAVLWFDTPTELMTKERAELFLPLLREHPSVIWNNRLGGGYKGDTETPEQRIPPQGIPGRDWETCMTINDTWGYKSYDRNFKSAETLLRNLIDIASKGGNYLLNVGPTSEGVIPAPEAERLRQMGAWLAVNGEAIYGTGPTCFGAEDGAFSPTEKDAKGQPKFIPAWEWRCTTKPGRVYLHLFAWQAEPFRLHGAAFHVARAYLLADPQRTPLALTQANGEVAITLPGSAPDPIASVVCLETD